MKLPNGYDSVIRMSRHRRKPYTARVTVGWTDDGRQIKKYIGKLTFAAVYDLWCRYK